MKQRLVTGFDHQPHTREQNWHMPSSMTTPRQRWDGWWSPSDLFFMKDALERGMTCGDVAGFLSRGEDEVRNKAKQMKMTYRRSRLYCHYHLRRGA